MNYAHWPAQHNCWGGGTECLACRELSQSRDMVVPLWGLPSLKKSCLLMQPCFSQPGLFFYSPFIDGAGGRGLQWNTVLWRVGEQRSFVPSRQLGCTRWIYYLKKIEKTKKWALKTGGTQPTPMKEHFSFLGTPHLWFLHCSIYLKSISMSDYCKRPPEPEFH